MTIDCDISLRFTQIFECLKNMWELSRSCPQLIRWSSGGISAVHHNPHKGKDWLEKSRTVLAKKTVSEKQTRSCLHCTVGWIPDTPSLPAQSQEVTSHYIWALFTVGWSRWLSSVLVWVHAESRVSSSFGSWILCSYIYVLCYDSRSLVIPWPLILTFIVIKFSSFHSVTSSFLAVIFCWSFFLLVLVASYTFVCFFFQDFAISIYFVLLFISDFVGSFSLSFYLIRFYLLPS
jgi:hypothetical protein